MRILNTEGRDIGPLLQDAAETAGIPLRLALACAIAESGLHPYAERWGKRTEDALGAIDTKDWTLLAAIIAQAGNDISFGYGQQIVKYHYAGTGENTVGNCLNVRSVVFANPDENLRDMARRLAGTLRTARANDLAMVGGDEILGALTVYNAGHWPKADEWPKYQPRIANYRQGIAQADTLLAETPGKVDTEIHTTEENPVTIEEFVEQHPETAIWTPDGSPGRARDLGDGVRLAGSAEHVLIEIDGYVWTPPIDMSFFAPAPEATE